MSCQLRILGKADLSRVQAYVRRSPIENLFLDARLHSYGMDFHRVGLMMASLRDGQITSLLVDGGTLFVSGNEPEAIPDFATAIGARRRATSLMGTATPTLALFEELSRRFGPLWSDVSNVRAEQPLMLLTRDPDGPRDARVRRLTTRHYRSYLQASVHMYSSEIGSSPYKYGPGYDSFVRDRLRKGDAWGIVVDNEVIFKADVGPHVPGHAQLQGVWVAPHLRGTGLAAPALAAMLTHVRQEYPLISLYVNHFNTPAIRAYQRLGFERVGTLATVHY